MHEGKIDMSSHTEDINEDCKVVAEDGRLRQKMFMWQ
jgi:hypothetical protein